MAKPRLEQLLNLLKKMPKDSFLNYALAMEYIGIEKRQKAIELLSDLLKDDPNYLACYYQLAKLLEQSNKDKAIALYKQGATIAQMQGDNKTLNEINQALLLLEEEE